MTEGQRERIALLHRAAVKAAQRMTAATPGTRTYATRARSYDLAESAFAALVASLPLSLASHDLD